MNEHDAFLRKIVEDPTDDGPRLVYADWLEERGETDRAEFLRTECQLAALPRGDERRKPLKARLEALKVDEAWIAAISKASLENCEFRFEFECPQQWDRLKPTADAMVRFCEVCEENVHFCGSIQTARQHAMRGRCVAVNLQVSRKPPNDALRLVVIAGGVAPRPRPSGEERSPKS
jgi:uncharacterized protein (TIGR02996 family)